MWSVRFPQAFIPGQFPMKNIPKNMRASAIQLLFQRLDDRRSTTSPSGRSLSSTLGWSLRRQNVTMEPTTENGMSSKVLRVWICLKISWPKEITWEVRYRYITYCFLYNNMCTANVYVYILIYIYHKVFRVPDFETHPRTTCCAFISYNFG